LRVAKIEEDYGVRVITIKLCRSLSAVDPDGNLLHISADFKHADGQKEIERIMAIHKVPTPWAIILDHAGSEPIAYGNGYVSST
jgi:hypothetical protein